VLPSMAKPLGNVCVFVCVLHTCMQKECFEVIRVESTEFQVLKFYS